jgi:hypothetical protein
MPKNKEIGGCAGTQYGCCPDGVTAKKDADGTNCPTKRIVNLIDLSATIFNIKHNKLYYTPLHKIGTHSVYVENYKHKCVFGVQFSPNKEAIKRGFKPLFFEYKLKYTNLSKKYRHFCFDSINNLPNLDITSGSKIPSFIFTTIKTLLNNSVTYITMKGISIGYYNMTFGKHTQNYGVSTATDSNGNSNQQSFVDFLNNWVNYVIIATLAAVGATVAKILGQLNTKILEASKEYINKLFAKDPALENTVDKISTNVRTAIRQTENRAEEIADEIVPRAEQAGVVIEESEADAEAEIVDAIYGKDAIERAFGITPIVK